MENTNALEMLEHHPEKVSGAWVFKGTRVPVSALVENLKDGASIDQFLEWFPGVACAQVEALLDYELRQWEQNLAHPNEVFIEETEQKSAGF